MATSKRGSSSSGDEPPAKRVRVALGANLPPCDLAGSDGLFDKLGDLIVLPPGGAAGRSGAVFASAVMAARDSPVIKKMLLSGMAESALADGRRTITCGADTPGGAAGVRLYFTTIGRGSSFAAHSATFAGEPARDYSLNLLSLLAYATYVQSASVPAIEAAVASSLDGNCAKAYAAALEVPSLALRERCAELLWDGRVPPETVSRLHPAAQTELLNRALELAGVVRRTGGRDIYIMTPMAAVRYLHNVAPFCAPGRRVAAGDAAGHVPPTYDQLAFKAVSGSVSSAVLGGELVKLLERRTSDSRAMYGPK